jgi:hypothetical protein
LGPTTGPGALEKINSILLLRLQQPNLDIEENAKVYEGCNELLTYDKLVRSRGK